MLVTLGLGFRINARVHVYVCKIQQLLPRPLAMYKAPILIYLGGHILKKAGFGVGCSLGCSVRPEELRAPLTALLCHLGS